MISWKYSFETVRRELEVVGKKKQALGALLNAGKISKTTYDLLDKDLAEATARIEAHQKRLSERMTARANELEKQLRSLEVFLANLETDHASEEIGEEMYKQQGDAINLGIEATKQELNEVKGALAKLISEEATPPSAQLAPRSAKEEPREKSVEETVEEKGEGDRET